MMLRQTRVNNQKSKRFQANSGLSGSSRHKSLRPHIEGDSNEYNRQPGNYRSVNISQFVRVPGSMVNW